MMGTLKGLLSAIFALGTRRPEKEGGRRECEQPGRSNLTRLDGRIRFDQIFLWRKKEWQIFGCGVKGQMCSMSTSRPAMPPTTMRGEVEERRKGLSSGSCKDIRGLAALEMQHILTLFGVFDIWMLQMKKLVENMET